MKRNPGAKRRITGRAGKFGLKGPMARQAPAMADRPDPGTRTKGRTHWEPKAQ